MDTRNRHAFTLVEVIVVAVLVAVLALAAVTLYAGWVRQARRDAVEEIAQTAAAAANAYRRKTGTHPPAVDALDLFVPDTRRYTVDINDGSQPPTVIVTDNKYDVSATASY